MGSWSIHQTLRMTFLFTTKCVSKYRYVQTVEYSLSSAASDRSFGLCFWHIFSVMNRTCWTTGSWRWCLSLDVVSSIPAGSMIIFGSFVGLYAFPCARASKLNRQICISPVPGRSSKFTRTGFEDYTCAFQTSCQSSSAASGFDTISVALSERAGQLATGGVASVRRSWVRSPPSPRECSVHLWVSLCQSIQIQPTNMYVIA